MMYDPKFCIKCSQYSDVIKGTMASLIFSLTNVYSTVHPGTDQRNVKAPHCWRPVNSPRRWPVTQKMLPLDDVIMLVLHRRYFLVAMWLFIVYLKAGYHHVIDVRISDVLIKRHIYGRDTPAKNVPNPLDIERSDISSYFLQQTKCLVKIWVRLQAHK